MSNGISGFNIERKDRRVPGVCWQVCFMIVYVFRQINYLQFQRERERGLKCFMISLPFAMADCVAGLE
jgi:hypothetical protein